MTSGDRASDMSVSPGGHRPRVVVGIDGSPGSLAALDVAVDEARWRGAVLEAVMAWHSPEYTYVGPTMMPIQLESALELGEQAKENLAQALERVPEGVSLEHRVLEGHPGQVLLHEAEGADLLVVGTRGRGGFTGLLLGSVSQACAHHAACPVLVVPLPAPQR